MIYMSISRLRLRPQEIWERDSFPFLSCYCRWGVPNITQLWTTGEDCFWVPYVFSARLWLSLLFVFSHRSPIGMDLDLSVLQVSPSELQIFLRQKAGPFWEVFRTVGGILRKYLSGKCFSQFKGLNQLLALIIITIIPGPSCFAPINVKPLRGEAGHRRGIWTELRVSFQMPHCRAFVDCQNSN